MDAQRWQRLELICHGALERSGRARDAFVRAMCGDDRSLAADVWALVRASEGDPEFLEAPALARTPNGAPPSAASVSASPTAAAAGVHAGTLLGSFRCERLLGRGGMGEVWLATRQITLDRTPGASLEQQVAIKVMRTALGERDSRRRFATERRILASLQHPDIARFIDAGTSTEGIPWVAMEYVDGEPLTAWCTARALSFEGRVALLERVCRAVHAAHQSLVLHRDLKPANILVTVDGAPKLLDFGVARLTDPAAHSGETAPTARIFTPEYAAPEQRDGRAVSTATDVYALGLIAREVLRDTSSGRTGARGDAETVIAMALRDEPERRYHSAAALADDLARVVAGHPVVARGDDWQYRARKFVVRHAVAFTGLSLATVALVAIAVVSRVQSGRVARAAARTALERDKALEVRGFLLEMFGASGADQSVGDTVSVRALLDRQRAQVDASYGARPALAADMLEVLAEGYDRLGLFAEALPLADRALALRRALYDSVTRVGDLDARAEADRVLSAALNLAGWIRYERGDFVSADVLLREAEARRRAAGPSEEEALSRTLNDRGVLFNATKAYARADTVLREALAIRERVYGPAHRTVGITANNLAAALYFSQRLDEAVPVQARAVAALDAAFGGDHQRTVVALSNLAAFKRARGDLAGAEHDYRELIVRQTRLQGAAHPVTARMQSALAVVLADRARTADASAVRLALVSEADTLARAALRSLTVALGLSHPQVASTQTRVDQLVRLRDSLARMEGSGKSP
jgi:serine/threonine-protein kinase